jgi:hypothetical protein
MRLISTVILAAASLALAAPAAHAAGFDNVFGDYKKDGKIDPCRWSAADLERAKDDVPPDIEQYAPDFPDALDVAIEARAKGACKKDAKKPAGSGDAAAPAAPTPPASGGSAPAPAAGTPAAPTPGAAPDPTPAPTASATPAGAPTDGAIAKAADARRASSGAGDAPAPLVGLGVLAALLALAALAYGLARWLAWEPAWALRARHAAGEAGWRAGNTWSEFADWVRLGR